MPASALLVTLEGWTYGKKDEITDGQVPSVLIGKCFSVLHLSVNCQRSVRWLLSDVYVSALLPEV